MHDFLKSWRFKVLLAVAILLVAIILRAAASGGLGTLTSNVLSAITTPVMKISAAISDAATGFFSKFVNVNAIYDENQRLKEENQQLYQQLIDYETVKRENELYVDFLEIKETNPDFQFEPAAVIGNDHNDRFYSFTIDKGSTSGVSIQDPVITADGLVGIVSEVFLTSARVTTILDVANNVSVYNLRTRDTGIVTGTVELSQKGMCKMIQIPRDSGAAVGDLILTAGSGGIFPSGLVVGKISAIYPETNGISLYAEITPMADIQSVRDVLVLTSFTGQRSAGGTGTDQLPADSGSQSESSSENNTSDSSDSGDSPSADSSSSSES
jgi:rod shape-determining protein MreC